MSGDCPRRHPPVVGHHHRWGRGPSCRAHDDDDGEDALPLDQDKDQDQDQDEE